MNVETPIGVVTVLWTDKGIREIRLPGSSRQDASDSELSKKDTIPGPIQRAISRVVQHIEGKSQHFDEVPLDLSACPAFHRRVYRELRKIPSGKTVTYGELAKRVGSPGAARAVGQAMAANPIPIIIPCHRVLRADGSVGNYSALKGTESKVMLLESEGIRFKKAGAQLKREK